MTADAYAGARTALCTPVLITTRRDRLNFVLYESCRSTEEHPISAYRYKMKK